MNSISVDSPGWIIRKQIEKKLRGRGINKHPIVGILERQGGVTAQPFDDKKLSNQNLRSMLMDHVDLDESILMTDKFGEYKQMIEWITHRTIDHDK